MVSLWMLDVYCCPIGESNANPFLRMHMYKAVYLDGDMVELKANRITEPIYKSTYPDSNGLPRFK